MTKHISLIYKPKIICQKDKLCLLINIFKKNLLWHFQKVFPFCKK